jgi:ADP-heptose:LPS heptosyltransferase
VEVSVRVLVVRLSSLGDIARLLPTLRAARVAHPGHGFDLTVEDRFLPLLRLFPSADRVVAYPRRAAGHAMKNPWHFACAMREYFRSLRSGRYELAVDLHGILRSAAVARLSGARAVAGFARGFGREGSHLLYDIPVTPAPSPCISRLERYSKTLEALGLGGGAPVPLAPDFPGETVRARDEFLRRSDLAPGKYALLFVGTSRAQAHKRWPVDRFVQLAGVLKEVYRLPTLLGWGPEEAETVRCLPSLPYLRPLPETDLAGLVSYIAAARAFAGADTGSTHLAALMGVPAVGILGPTDPVKNALFGSRSRVVWKEGIRRACPGAGCTHGDCMGAISAEEVAEALQSVAAL